MIEVFLFIALIGIVCAFYAIWLRLSSIEGAMLLQARLLGQISDSALNHTQILLNQQKAGEQMERARNDN